jgi:hypothetical protein
MRIIIRFPTTALGADRCTFFSKLMTFHHARGRLAIGAEEGNAVAVTSGVNTHTDSE